MDFATKMSDGHMGARKFWRENLPRLKYHNPSVPMIVNRHDDNHSSPLMTIYLGTRTASAETVSQPASSRKNLSKAQPPGPGEKAVTIDMKDRHSSDILGLFMAETQASSVEPSKEDLAEMQSLEDTAKKSSADRARMQKLRAEEKKEKDMLKRARAAGGMAEQEEA